MKQSLIVSEDFKEVTLTIKFPIDELLDRFSRMFYHKLNESNHKIMEVIHDSDETLCRLKVCELLNISSTTLTKRIKDGSIPYSRVGSRYVFSKKDVLAAIKK
ncbi:helix-turn-helix domain-containing protein [Sphingobacterium bovisgrunnientis]|uniref:helix-turn-helix domain-containing protein n=1 Tax=Sphingobacterium bovisgrunnientis TaxID=1874697 RepID=UPI0013581D43|nr:helix-turn-helix domain-containing protein [Sphingobacterium bovisgrunnientis]